MNATDPTFVKVYYADAQILGEAEATASANDRDAYEARSGEPESIQRTEPPMLDAH
jgi:hypothetical protein